MKRRSSSDHSTYNRYRSLGFGGAFDGFLDFLLLVVVRVIGFVTGNCDVFGYFGVYENSVRASLPIEFISSFL